MTVTTAEKDLEELTVTLRAEFDAPPERVWELWADPRQLERWWGPPTHPATVEEHELRPGGRVSYFMTGPEGDRYRGWWRIIAVDAPNSLDFADGFADEDGNPVEGMPVSTVRVELHEHDGGTRMELRSTAESREQLEQLLEMGALEGMKEAMGQMDALLAE
jgi:uncharacterized protein YndB with AHSA1/START domain